jgi:hypothetical protein
VHRNFWGCWGIGTYPEAVQRKFISKYLGYVTHLDAEIGRLLAALEEEGLAGETRVCFTSDQGDMLGRHGLYDKGPFMYDDIYRVPLLVRRPGVTSPGRSQTLVYNMDLAATLWDLAGQSVPPPGSARSLLPVLTGQADDLGRELLVFAYWQVRRPRGHLTPCPLSQRGALGRGGSEGTQRNMQGSVIIAEFWRQFDFYPPARVHSGTDKYVFNFGGVDEYYDLKQDPLELENRIADPAVWPRVEERRDYLLQWMRRVDSPMREGPERTLPAKSAHGEP